MPVIAIIIGLNMLLNNCINDRQHMWQDQPCAACLRSTLRLQGLYKA